MDEKLLGVINYSRWAGFCVDFQQLTQITTRLELSDIHYIDWKSVKYLYILDKMRVDDSSVEKPEEGIYSSEDFSWVLVFARCAKSNMDILKQCTDNLELLYMNSDTDEILDISSLTGLQQLVLQLTQHNNYSCVVGLSKLVQLISLTLINYCWDEELDLSGMTKLIDLSLWNSEVPPEHRKGLRGVHNLRHIEQLVLFYVETDMLLDVSELTRLRLLHLYPLCFGHKKVQVDGLSKLSDLEDVEIEAEIRWRRLDLSRLKKIKRLFLNETALDYVKGFSALQDLVILSLSRSGIHKIPNDIRTLHKLQHLNLSNLHLLDLPDWLPELGLVFDRKAGTNGIDLSNTQVDGVDMSIFDQSQEMILQWFEERKRGNAVPLNEVKVVFLGDGEAGKTHTIARLLANGEKPTDDNFDGKATPGIVIKNKEYELDGKKIQVHFWDFGGQEILHSMHRMFLTDRTLYVVIINARDDTQEDRARYWLHNIKSFAGSAPVLLVLNKIDQNPNASIDTPNLQKMYGGLKEVVRMSALEDSLEQFNSTFTEALLRQVQELGTLGTLWPKSWLALKTGLEKMESNYIHGMDYEDLCESCGVDQNREDLLQWFNDLGVSFCYDGSDKLEDYVILKPEWLTNAIYIILFNKCPDTENGIIPLKAINRMLRAPRKGQKDEIRRVLKDVFYDPTETDYVMDVIRKFRLSYEVRKDAEFIPVLCQRESMAVADEYESDPNALEFKMEFEYLPDNVIHRLMVEMRQDLDTRNVWRTGARFAQQGTRLSAVVRSEGDVLRIFVRSESANHRPNTYLHIIKGNIDRIVADMKLTPPYCEVIYKADGITEAFDYEDLIAAQQDGCDTYRSKQLRRSIPIQDILNQSGRTAEVELDKLRAAIITACMQFQDNRKFWDATEDELNTYVRDVLRNKGYIVCDQTFQGTGGGEKRAGELDLEIRQKPDIPWTIYEALKITAKSRKITKKALTGWNSHLRKLLDNYNPSGLNYLFLVTYVDCDKEKYQDLWENVSEHIRWHNAGDYERLPNSFSPISLDMHNNPNYIRAVRCTYDRAGSPTTVCHIFARMGR